jgi:hypothetical protein
MNIDTNTNYLTNSLAKAQEFVGKVAEGLRTNTYETKYGYNTNQGSFIGSLGQTLSEPSKVVSNVIGDVLTNKTLGNVWKYTNVPRMAGELGTKIAQRTGVDPVTGAVMAAAAPIALMSLSGTRGPISQGLRPLGYKAVAPKSKEEDPTGRIPQSIPLEIALRYGLGQRSQMLPYQEFKKERPDIDPITYSQYRRYTTSKPAPGQLIGIDPEGQSFTTIGGTVRGTAKGLNDPEIRIKGQPVTASAMIGTVAGLGTAAALYKKLPKDVREARVMHSTSFSPETKEERSRLETELSPLESKQLQLKRIIDRLESKMQTKGVKPIDKYGPSPDDQAAMRVHKQAIENRGELNSLTDELKTYKYALGRATGQIPAPVDDPEVEKMMAAPSHPTDPELGGMGSQTTKTQRSYYNRKRRVAAGLDPEDVSYSPENENISYLRNRISNLSKRKTKLLSDIKDRLDALNIPEEALNLQDRLTRAKSKAGEVSSKVDELQQELRTTYRPTTVYTPSTATIAGLAVAGTAAAVGTAYVTRKLMQKASERRMKKENPVEYLKYKHGSLEQASQALGAPGARNWQQLAPYVNNGQ